MGVSDYRERNIEECGYPYKFSIVMAVYNVEEYIKEAIDSIIKQNIGFKENVQLILVDDGSPDGSGAICDEYQENYPENIKVIHKENGGVSSARNEGLKYIEGRYVNFLDPDDKFSLNTLKRVYRFFNKNDQFIDVVAVPRRFFGGRSGEHNLNYRFRKGARVADLREEYTAIQNTTSTAFFTQEIAQMIKYDSRLKYCEDTLYACQALLPKMRLGLVTNCTHYTRKRVLGVKSATQTMETDIQWFVDTLNYLSKGLVKQCIETLGYVPKFVQFTIMYELQWKLILSQFPDSMLSEQQADLYFEGIHEVLQYIDDDIILSQKNMNIEYKMVCFKHKYACAPIQYFRENDVLLHYGNTNIFYLSKSRCFLEVLSIKKERLYIEGYVISPIQVNDGSIFINAGGEFIKCTSLDIDKEKYSLGISIRHVYGFSVDVEIKKEVLNKFSFYISVDGELVGLRNLIMGKNVPLTQKLKRSYYFYNGWKMWGNKRNIYVEPCDTRQRIVSEFKLWKELWRIKETGSRKAILARVTYFLLSIFKRKPIWLVTDRINKADDNGQVFFEYIMQKGSKDIKRYFVLKHDSSDFKKLNEIGKVVEPMKWKYKLLFLLSDKIISSHADDFMLDPFSNYRYYYCDLYQNHDFVFLQHGITKDDLSKWLNKYNVNISLFVTSAIPEYKSILSGKYYYTAKEVKLTGFPRYDRLFHNEKKYITIMPSWRSYLVQGVDRETGLRSLKQGFEESTFFNIYQYFFGNERLLTNAERLGYQIQYFPHPNMVLSTDKFNIDPRIRILSIEESYQKIFAESNLIITDYSSVAFDFAYLRKPVVYCQVDYEEFFSGAHTYDKGYFDYERDGFGEVEYDLESTIDRIIEYMENGCQLKEKYRERIDNFFAYNDQNNCERVYEAILNIEKE